MARISKKPKKENIGRKNAVIYARYSSSQSEQSIEGQLRINTEFAERMDTQLLIHILIEP